MVNANEEFGQTRVEAADFADIETKSGTHVVFHPNMVLTHIKSEQKYTIVAIAKETGKYIVDGGHIDLLIKFPSGNMMFTNGRQRAEEVADGIYSLSWS